MNTVKDWEAIENTIRLNPQAMEMLKQIAISNKQSTYSDLVIFLGKFYLDNQKARSFL